MSIDDKVMNAAFNTKAAAGFLGQLHQMGTELVSHYATLRRLPAGYLDRTDQWAIGLYLFGLANGLGARENAEPIQVEHGMTGVLQGLFGYDADTAQRYVQTWIQDLLTGNPNNLNYAVIHEGANCYNAWRKGNKASIAAAVLKIADAHRR
jgi:hypothetical protein